jgi:hypothetical protein
MSVFGSDGTDPEESSGLLEPGDTLDDLDGVTDVLDTGWSPPERPWGVEEWGTTEREERAGESLDGRLARELPDPRDDDGDGLGDASDTDGELVDDEVGERRAGRLVETEARWGDVEPELHATDVGIDGAAASAEEAAVHIVRRWDDDVR